VLWRAVNPNLGASFATRAVVPAQRITALRALGGTSRGRAFPITDPRIPVANANHKAPALVIEAGLPVSALAGWLPTGPFAARAHLRKICPRMFE
jgi:hypothetical protein